MKNLLIAHRMLGLVFVILLAVLGIYHLTRPKRASSN